MWYTRPHDTRKLNKSKQANVEDELKMLDDNGAGPN